MRNEFQGLLGRQLFSICNLKDMNGVHTFELAIWLEIVLIKKCNGKDRAKSKLKLRLLNLAYCFAVPCDDITHR